MFNPIQAQQSSPQPLGRLLPHHRDHFRQDGWEDAEIEQAIAWGVRSVSQIEAERLLGYRPPSGGIWFPFSADWGQLRPDTPYPGGGPKYLSPTGGIDSRATWEPPSAAPRAATEGWKDAARPTIRCGIPIAAIAGVSHVAKALPAGCGTDLIFDSDAWINADVIQALIAGAVHTGGKVAIVPGAPDAKRGLTEFLNDAPSTAAARLEHLLGDAVAPHELFEQWLARLIAAPLQPIKNAETVGRLCDRIARIGLLAGLSKKAAAAARAQFWQAYRRAKNAKLRALQSYDLADAPVGEFEPIELSQQRALIALNGTVGTAKTSQGIFGAVRAALELDQRAAIICPTQALCANVAARLREFLPLAASRIATHLEDGAARADVLITCPESLHKAIDRKWHLVAWDEANESIPRAIEGTLCRNPRATRAALKKLLADAHTVILANDGLHRPVAAVAARLMGIPLDQMQLIQRRRPPAGNKITLYPDLPSWASALRDSVASQRVALPSGSQIKLRQIEQWLGLGDAAKIIDKPETMPEDRAAFMADPDGIIAATAPNLLGFSPTANSGVSIEAPYFDSQFEYITGRESASSALQRGARVRAALSSIPRHLFCYGGGIATDPNSLPWEVLGAEYWLGILGSDNRADIAAVLKPLGLEKTAKQALSDRVTLAAEFPEIGEICAIRAREIYFKPECLADSFSADGYQVTTAAALDRDAAAEIGAGLKEAREILLDRNAGKLAAAPTIDEAEISHPQAIARWELGQDPESPTEGRWFTAWGIERIIGDVADLADQQFWANGHLDPHGSYIQALQLRAALDLAWNQPETFEQWNQWRALAAIALDPPRLPIPPKIIELAALLKSAPGLRAARDRSMLSWDKNSEILQAAKRWATGQAAAIARLTKHSKLIHGLQFTAKTRVVTCFHKLLGMIGLETQSIGQEARFYQYRLQTTQDIDRAIAAAARKGRDTRKLAREGWRLENAERLALQIASHSRAIAAATAYQWESEIEKLLPEISPAKHFSKDIPPTKVLCTPPPPPPPPQQWRYIGQKYAALYGGVALILHKAKAGVASYLTPDGRITTWLYPEDVALA